jgi:hypothetical protein
MKLYFSLVLLYCREKNKVQEEICFCVCFLLYHLSYTSFILRCMMEISSRISEYFHSTNLVYFILLTTGFQNIKICIVFFLVVIPYTVKDQMADSCEHNNEPSRSVQTEEFLDSQTSVRILRMPWN